MLRRIYILLFLLGFSMATLKAQNLQFEHYSEVNGLSHNSVRHITQDQYGFLWLGTFGGLNRFDGYSCKTYLSSSKKVNTINNDDITALVIDDKTGNMWIGTNNGLTLHQMNTGVFTTYLPEKDNPQSIPDGQIRAVYIDKFNRIWVGTKTRGLCIFDREKNVFERVDLDGIVYVKSICEDTEGNIWLGSYSTHGVVKIKLDDNGDIADIKRYALRNPLSDEVNPYINFIYEDHKADLFIGTRSGLYKMNKEEDDFNLVEVQNNSSGEEIGTHFICVARSPEGKYWVGTWGGLIVCDDLEDLTDGDFELNYSVISETSSLVDNLIYDLYFDDNGILWVGTENGLDKYDPFMNQFKWAKNISSLTGDKAPQISGFCESYDKNLVVATHDKGLFIREKNDFRLLSDKYKEISSIHTFDGRFFYCGLWNGKVFVFDYLKKTGRLVDVGFDGVPIFSICKLSNGKLVVGSFGQGAVVFNPRDDSIDKSLQELISDYEINKIIVKTDNEIWMATEEGVLEYDFKSNELNKYVSENSVTVGLTHDNVKDILVDQKGTLWAATRVGLNFYDPLLNNFVPVVNPEELYKKWITNLAIDRDGYIWLNMNHNRMVRYDTRAEEAKLYHVENGSRIDIFSLGGFYYSTDGTIYVGTKKGIIYFNANELRDHEEAAWPFITSFQVDNKEIEIGDVINGQLILQEDINVSKAVELEHSNRNFAMTFSCASYTQERNNKFMYKLEGFDKEWNTVDVNKRTIQYVNLFFGDYTFKVKACNSAGYWSKPVSYNIHILPPLWLTYKAILVYLIVLALIIWQSRRIVIARMKLKQELMLEKVKREKDEKLNDEKLRFFTNISHELKTPLSLIIGPIKDILEKERYADANLHKQHQLIHRNASRLMLLVNQILEFRKAVSGELKLKVTNIDIKEHTKYTFDSFIPMSKEKEIDLNFICSEESLVGWIDCDKFDKVLYNILSNAFKYAPKGSKVDLTMYMSPDDNRKLVVEVQDEGPGIPEEYREKIFTRFYQLKQHRAQNTGSGIGLSFVRKLVILHHGRIWVESEEGKGSNFIFEIPIDKSLFEDYEVFDMEAQSAEVSYETYDLKSNEFIVDGKLKEKILVVEDNSDLRTFIAGYLSESYHVYEAENGAEGLELCKEIKPTLVVSDVMMPVMDGFELCSKLKNDEEISHIPVVLLTALSEDEKRIRGYKTGADDYLVKPFDPSLLKVRIDNLIAGRNMLKQKYLVNAESGVEMLTHSPVDEEFMKTITHFVEEHMIDPDLNVDMLCRAANVSSSKLYRKLKELTNLSPNDFIRSYRLKKAAQLLQTKQYNVSEVSDLVGFSDPLYFSRCFKKQFGFPPSKMK
ncbi:hybrid sensor histidine kinase/response regulator [Puteibacter caeruleilacunae]|nr:hybrid sensor histidine kinase/response regulator [Puteibacter caeruleilacunae]